MIVVPGLKMFSCDLFYYMPVGDQNLWADEERGRSDSRDSIHLGTFGQTTKGVLVLDRKTVNRTRGDADPLNNFRIDQVLSEEQTT